MVTGSARDESNRQNEPFRPARYNGGKIRQLASDAFQEICIQCGESVVITRYQNHEHMAQDKCHRHVVLSS